MQITIMRIFLFRSSVTSALCRDLFSDLVKVVAASSPESSLSVAIAVCIGCAISIWVQATLTGIPDAVIMLASQAGSQLAIRRRIWSVSP